MRMKSVKLTFFQIIFLCCFLGWQPIKSNAFSILIDPGHGGKDSGAVSDSGLKESELNFYVGKYLGQLLSREFIVYFTRQSDKYVSLKSRIKIVRQLNPDLFISIHHNASLKGEKINEALVFYNCFDYGISKKLSECIILELSKLDFVKKTVVLPGGFYVLRNNPVPSLLIECSYLTNPEVEKKLKYRTTCSQIAYKIYKGILNWYCKFKPAVYFKVKDLITTNKYYIEIPFIAYDKVSLKEYIDSLKIRWKIVRKAGSEYYIKNISPLRESGKKHVVEFYLRLKNSALVFRKKITIKAVLPLRNVKFKPLSDTLPENFCKKIPFFIKFLDSNLNPLYRRFFLKLECNGLAQQNFCTDDRGETVLFLDIYKKNNIFKIIIDNREFIKKIDFRIKKGELKTIKFVNKASGSYARGIIISYKNRIIIPYRGLACLFFAPHEFSKQIKFYKDFNFYDLTIRKNSKTGKISEIFIDTGKFQQTRIGLIYSKDFESIGRILKVYFTKSGAVCKNFRIKDDIWSAILAINRNAFDYILSLRQNKNFPVIHHYHSSKKGKRLAEILAFFLKVRLNLTKDVVVSAGDEFELGHVGPPAIVLNLPYELIVSAKQKVNFANAILESYKVYLDI